MKNFHRRIFWDTGAYHILEHFRSRNMALPLLSLAPFVIFIAFGLSHTPIGAARAERNIQVQTN